MDDEVFRAEDSRPKLTEAHGAILKAGVMEEGKYQERQTEARHREG